MLVLAGWLHCEPHGHSLWSEFEYRVDDHGGEPYICCVKDYYTTRYVPVLIPDLTNPIVNILVAFGHQHIKWITEFFFEKIGI